MLCNRSVSLSPEIECVLSRLDALPLPQPTVETISALSSDYLRHVCTLVTGGTNVCRRSSRACCCQWLSRASTFSAQVRTQSPRPPRPYRWRRRRITSALRRRRPTSAITATKRPALVRRRAFERRLPQWQCRVLGTRRPAASAEGCDGVQIRMLSDSHSFLQIRNPTDFPARLRRIRI